MGIPSYFAHIVKQYKNVIKPFIKQEMVVDNLYLDCNSIIYDAVHSGLTDETLIIDAVCLKLCYYLRLLKPSQRVIIAFDGVAPVAKLDQQRRRRFMTWYQKQTDQLKPATSFNTASITPGTHFMQQLSTRIKQRFHNPHEFDLKDIIVSASDEVGEGEHKIYAYIRANAVYHKDTLTVIYGLDADLIMLTLNHLHVAPKMYLFRETPEFIKHIDRTLNPNEMYVLDIPIFAECIAQELKPSTIGILPAFNQLSVSATTTDYNYVFDYIFMCFFLGNDFMPHFPALNIRTKGIERLINAYYVVFKDTTDTLTINQTKIQWHNVRKLLTYLSEHEHNYLTEEYNVRGKMSHRLKTIKRSNSNNHQQQEDDMLINLPLLERDVELRINPSKPMWQHRYYTSLFKSPFPLQDICINYLQGLEWNLNYYSTGCLDWRWTFKYAYPPLLAELVMALPPTNLYSFFSKKNSINTAVHPLVQLSYVIPKEDLTCFLPASLTDTLVKQHAVWYIGRGEEVTFQWAFCKFLWEAHVNLPEIDLPALEKIVKEYIK